MIYPKHISYPHIAYALDIIEGRSEEAFNEDIQKAYEYLWYSGACGILQGSLQAGIARFMQAQKEDAPGQ